MEQLLNKLTIVIPTHNRHHLLESRALPYFLELGVKLLVIDSTHTPHESSQNDSRIDYVHCPNEPLPHKMKTPVLKRVNTPYMLMNADDTLTSKQGIIDCLAFLEENPDYSSAKGLILQCFHDDKNRIQSPCLSKYLVQADSDRIEERPLQHFVSFSSLFYSVQRTDSWKTIFKRLPPEMVNYYLNETYVIMMTLIHGKSAKLKTFFNATEGGPSLFDDDLRFFCSPYKLAMEKRYRGEVEATKKVMVEYMAERAQIPESKALNYIDGALALYWLRSRDPKTLYDRVKNEWNSLLNKTFNKKHFKVLKAQKKALKLKQEKICTNEVLDALGSAGREDFKRLIKIIQATTM